MKKKLFAFILVLFLALSLSVQVFAYTVPSDTLVYVTETGSCYHRQDCSHLKSIRASYTISSAEALGYFPCSRCDPDWRLGAYEPSGSSSSGSSSHSRSSGPDVSQYLAQADALDRARAESGTQYEEPKSVGRVILTVVCAVLLGIYLLPIILGTLYALICCSIAVFRKTPPNASDKK